jgi:hypothetical protein
MEGNKMSIGYLSGKAIIDLKNAGVVLCLYDTSTTPQWLGDLTSVYFFNDRGDETAHQTGLSGECGHPEITHYSRKWGESTKRAYKKSAIFEKILSTEICENSIYRIV